MMHSFGPLVHVLALAGAAAASPAPTPAKAPEPLLPRQTDDGLLKNLFKLADAFEVNACIPYALPLVGELPPIPKGLVGNDLVTQALSQTTLPLSGVCDFSVTGDVGGKFTDYLPVWYSWYGDKSETIQSIISHCSKATALVQTIEAFTSCAQYKSATATYAGGDGDDASTTADSSSSSATTTSEADSTSTEEEGTSSTTTTTEEASSSSSSDDDAGSSPTTSEATSPSETDSGSSSSTGGGSSDASPTESTPAQAAAAAITAPGAGAAYLAVALMAGFVGAAVAL